MSALGRILRHFPNGHPLRYEALGLLQGAYEGSAVMHGENSIETLDSLFELCCCLIDEDIFVNTIGNTLSRDVLHLPPVLYDAEEPTSTDGAEAAAEAAAVAMGALAEVPDPALLSPRSKVRWNVLRELGVAPEEYFGDDPTMSYINNFESACVAALNGFRKVLDERRKAYGNMHPETLDAAAKAGEAYFFGLGEVESVALDKAIPYLREAHNGYSMIYGVRSPVTMKVARTLADALLEADRPADAVPIFERLLEEAKRGAALSTEPHIVKLEQSYAEALAESGSAPEACRLLMDSSSRIRANIGFASEAYASSCVAWAHSLMLTRDIVGAARAFRIGASAYTACNGFGNPDAVDASMRASNCEALIFAVKRVGDMDAREIKLGDDEPPQATPRGLDEHAISQPMDPSQAQVVLSS